MHAGLGTGLAAAKFMEAHPGCDPAAMRGADIPLIGGGVAFALGAALYFSSTRQQAAQVAKVDDSAVLADNEKAVRRKVRGAELRDVFVSRRGGYPHVCCLVSAEFGLGEEIRFQRFLNAGDAGGVYLEAAADDFDALWSGLCGD